MSSLNHVGLNVPDIHAGIEWYCRVMGLRLISGPRMLVATTGISRELLGPRFRECRVAQLAAANGAGVELFEFKDPPTRPASPEPQFTLGWWHACFDDPEIDALAERIAASGGRLRTPVLRIWPDHPFRLAYCEDPFGNVLELLSHPFTKVFASASPSS